MKTLLISLKIFLFFTVLTGIIYPFLVTGISQLIFPARANGSFITERGKLVGSELIGQHFDSVIYFTSRPSAISYNPLPSGGSNLGLTNRKLKHSADSLRQQFIAFNQLEPHSAIPSEMVFASASGLDPHISPEAALMQVERIAKSRAFNASQKKQLLESISALSEGPQYSLFGEQRINVVLLNLNLNKIN